MCSNWSDLSLMEGMEQKIRISLAFKVAFAVERLSRSTIFFNGSLKATKASGSSCRTGLKNVGQDSKQSLEFVNRSSTNSNWRTKIGQGALEWQSMLHPRRVIKSKNCQDVTSIKSGSWLFQELDDTIFLSNQRHEHLHDLNFGKWLTSTDVTTVLNQVLHQLTWRRSSQLGWVVLDLQQTGLAVHRDSGCTNLLFPVDRVRLSTQCNNWIWTLGRELLGNQLVQPSSSDGVVLEVRSLKQLDQVLDGGSEVTPNTQFLQCNDHVSSRSLSVFTKGENVTELGVGKRVDGGLVTHREVTPNIGRRTEVQLVTVTLWNWATLCTDTVLVLEFEIDLCGCVRICSVKESDVLYSVKWDTHGNLQLGGREIDTRHHLCGWVFHLQSWVQFQKVEFVVCVGVKVLDSTSRNVSNQLTKSHSSRLHLSESFWLCDGDRSFFNNLLVSSLNRTISSEQRNVITVLIGQELHFQVSSGTSQLHDEDWRTWDFVGGLMVERDKVFFSVNFSDTFTTTSFGGFDHNREADFLGFL
ncbi:hypothetical protein OGAPHI_001982 [Ogataea philodendri]|uniref:Uncharacterized protein n=1 Tax=Ogataea philodendri TaxID=1378263 RepID=A0A9P8P9L3_9ASCO|nr:uncharacterized protein OGAPHI_001982 [Ogataea philodendri]KAH3668228.1 hypothetical protein OGAPHI_001982 [Ogataea philodendri]